MTNTPADYFMRMLPAILHDAMLKGLIEIDQLHEMQELQNSPVSATKH